MKNILFAFLAICLSLQLNAQSSISVTYNAGVIPSFFEVYDFTCNGPVTALTITLPSAPGNYEIKGIDISYDFTAANGAFMSEQRSQIHFQNTATSESQVYAGNTNEGGTLSYSRLNVDIANGFYSQGTDLIFEMRAWRTWGLTGCESTLNFIPNNSFIITVYFELCTPPAVVDKVFLSQSEIDAYVNLYGGCIGVAVGNLTVGQAGSTSDITDISGLSFL